MSTVLLKQIIARTSTRSLKTRQKRLLTDMGTIITFEYYKQRDKTVKLIISYKVPKVINKIKEDHWHRRFRDFLSRRKQGRYDRRQSTAMGRGRGGSGRGGGSRRGRITGRNRCRYAGKGQHVNDRKEKKIRAIQSPRQHHVYIRGEELC